MNFKLTRAVEFSSPSAASSIMLGRPSSGNDDWKTKDGVKLKDVDKEQEN